MRVLGPQGFTGASGHAPVAGSPPARVAVQRADSQGEAQIRQTPQVFRARRGSTPLTASACAFGAPPTLERRAVAPTELQNATQSIPFGCAVTPLHVRGMRSNAVAVEAEWTAAEA